MRAAQTLAADLPWREGALPLKKLILSTKFTLILSVHANIGNLR